MTIQIGVPPSTVAAIPTRHGRRALLLLTRDPGGELNGRKAVLATIARSLEELGHAVSVVVLSREPVLGPWQGRPLTWVRLPGLARVGLNATGTLLTRHGSLNESLFDSPGIRRAVVRIAQETGADYVVADGMRTTAAAQATGLPVIAHLDDLLSERYRGIRATGEQSRYEVLGFFEAQVPGLVRPLARSLARRLLRVEAELMDRREVEIVTRVAGCALTSPVEAAALSQRTGRPVACLPMAMDPVSDELAAVPSIAPPTSFVFLGSPSFGPNRASLRWWQAEIRPELDRLGAEDVTLTVIGHVDPEHRHELADDRLSFLGYVDDVVDELGRYRALVAPVTMGTGVKTKVVDALACGVPVVGTSRAVSGLPVRSGHDALIGDTAEDFARAVLRLRDDARLAARLGEAGRDLSGATFSTARVRAGWAELLDRLGLLTRVPSYRAAS